MNAIPFGYYSSGEEATPTYDPGIVGIDCPVCEKALTAEDLRTISLMERGGTRSLFYRLHKSCELGMTEAARVALDERVMQQAGQLGAPLA